MRISFNGFKVEFASPLGTLILPSYLRESPLARFGVYVKAVKNADGRPYFAGFAVAASREPLAGLIEELARESWACSKISDGSITQTIDLAPPDLEKAFEGGDA